MSLNASGETQILFSDFFRVSELFSISQIGSLPGNPAWADMKFPLLISGSENFKGPGVYALFFDDRLIYVGKFLGRKTNPFLGNIARARWEKHIGSMTLRSRAISFSKTSLQRILDESEEMPVSAIRLADHPTLLRDRGTLSTFNRYRFACQHWDLFSQLNETHLKRFQFMYVRLRPIDAILGQGTDFIRNLISKVENQLVLELKPYCNAVVADSSYPSPHTVASVRAKVESTLQAEIETISAAIPVASKKQAARSKISSIPSDQNLNDAQVNDGEPRSAEEIFFERLESAPEAAYTFIESLLAAFSENLSFEVHFTYTSVADLRIRFFGSGARRGGRNLFTLVWEPRSQSFFCRALAKPELVEKILGSSVTPPQNTTEPLASEFKIKIGNEKFQSVLDIVMASVRELQN